MQIDLIRHAPVVADGRLAGRRDVAADCGDAAALAWLRGAMGAGAVWVSPALRCRQTAAALGVAGREEARLWEQDFGTWEGERYDALPDLGPLSPEALAAHRPPGGESFDDLCARVQPVLAALDGDAVVLAHAGVVRAALALVVGVRALSFAVAPLSLTRLRRAGDGWAVDFVNRGYDGLG